MPCAERPPSTARPAGAVVWLARTVLRVFFRQIEIVDLERLPRGVPLMLVANHVNGLIDPALLLGFLDAHPRFLAKSTLWKNPVIKPFLELAAAIPVYRKQDGADTAKNAETFAACHDALRGGAAIAIFPEGRSHNEPSVVELKTGVSRIVLEAEAAFGPLGARIVPVGLTFDAKGRFRSRVVIHVGEPLDPSPELADYAAAPREAVHRLTERVREGLRGVTLNFPSWEEAHLIARAAQIYQHPRAELPDELPLADDIHVRRTFIAGSARLREHCPEEVARVAEVVGRYDAELLRHGLDDAQVASRYPAERAGLFVLKSLWLMLVRWPLALVGTVVHWPPYHLAGRVAKRRGVEPDAESTYKLFASLLFFPLTWLLAAAAAGWAWGWEASIGILALLPISAVVALRFHERREQFERQARAYLLLKSGKRSIAGLRELREEVVRSVGELVEVYRGLE